MTRRRRVAMVPVDVCHDARISAGAARYYAHLAAHTDRKTGITWISRARSAADLRVDPLTVTRWRRDLEAAGHVARLDGGYRGRCRRILLTAWVSPATRAAAALQASRASRDRAARAILAGLRKRNREPFRVAERVIVGTPGTTYGVKPRDRTARAGPDPGPWPDRAAQLAALERLMTAEERRQI